MGCACLGPTIRIRSNLSVSRQVFSQIQEEKKPGDLEEKDIINFSKLLELNLNPKCQNISNSKICLSGDDKEEDKKENKKENEKNNSYSEDENENENEKENDVNNSESDDVNKPIIVIV